MVKLESSAECSGLLLTHHDREPNSKLVQTHKWYSHKEHCEWVLRSKRRRCDEDEHYGDPSLFFEILRAEYADPGYEPHNYGQFKG